MKRKYILRHLTFGLLLVSASTNAMIIERGKENIDLNSGLAWLDVTETVGLSFNYVSSQLGEGGAYEGYRYATSAEFVGMMSEALGLPPTWFVNHYEFNMADSVDSPSMIDSLVKLLGDTNNSFTIKNTGMTADEFYGYAEGSGLGVHYTYGYLADPYPRDPGRKRYSALIYDREESTIGNDFAQAPVAAQWVTSAGENYGSFLVREIPTSSPLSLLGLGIVAMGFMSRKSRSANDLRDTALVTSFPSARLYDDCANGGAHQPPLTSALFVRVKRDIHRG